MKGWGWQEEGCGQSEAEGESMEMSMEDCIFLLMSLDFSMQGIGSRQKAFHHEKTVKSSIAWWYQFFSAKVISVIGKVGFVAHCNEWRSRLQTIGGVIKDLFI